MDIARNDIVRLLDASTRRRGAVAAEWRDDGPEYVPVRRFDWPLQEAGGHVAEGSGVPFEQWRELAEAFVAALGEDNVRRSA